ncbi:uncharacterized protein LOC128205218 [Mya arenaria]|uniref:uncharacterized protein LOC128205218 n=1 Tax=Mya arenaria TaxID=6604 RepID=UPI0022E86719|nr:uncharacterized protein LOC128205218 [Mya arenaria]
MDSLAIHAIHLVPVTVLRAVEQQVVHVTAARLHFMIQLVRVARSAQSGVIGEPAMRMEHVVNVQQTSKEQNVRRAYKGNTVPIVHTIALIITAVVRLKLIVLLVKRDSMVEVPSVKHLVPRDVMMVFVIMTEVANVDLGLQKVHAVHVSQDITGHTAMFPVLKDVLTDCAQMTVLVRVAQTSLQRNVMHVRMEDTVLTVTGNVV